MSGPAAPAIRLELPVPPSTNNLYLNSRGNRRVRAPNYNKWRDEAGWLARAQLAGRAVQRISGPVSVLMLLPLGRNRDLDNIKPIGDLLTHLGIIDDDCWIDRMTLERIPADDKAMVIVSIWPLA